jgi:hypothetical protein
MVAIDIKSLKCGRRVCNSRANHSLVSSYFFADSLIGLAIAFTGSELDEAEALALSAFGFFVSLLLRI